MILKLVVLCSFIALACEASPRRTVRIAGGTDAKPEDAPYFVSIWKEPTDSIISSFTDCGGSILNERWILTGAYCLTGLKEAELFVKAGSIYMFTHSENEQIIFAEAVFIHPKYDEYPGPYEMGLIKLKTPLKFNKFVQPIALPPADYVPSGSGTVMGLGFTSHAINETSSDTMKIVTLPIIKNDECKRLIDTVFQEESFEISEMVLDEQRFCTGPTKTNQAHCWNDIGDPLVTKVNGKEVIAGVAHGGLEMECTTPGLPSIYTKVTYFLKWIEDVMNANK